MRPCVYITQPVHASAIERLQAVADALNLRVNEVFTLVKE